MTRVNDKQKRSPLIRLLLIVGAVGLLIAIPVTYRVGRSWGHAEETVPLYTVARGPLTINVVESGTIKPREQEVIKSEIEGRATILYLIPEGTRVQEGDLLVELDASQLQDQQLDQDIQVQNAEASFIQSRENLEVVKNQAASDIDKAELTLRFAKEDLDQYLNGEYPNALREHEARITLAQEEAQRAREKLKWSRVLFKEKYLSESELQADELSVKKADLDVELAQNNRKLLEDFTRKRTVAQRESDVKQAEMALERIRRKASSDIVQAEVGLRAKESEFNRQTDKHQKLKEQIAKARIVAPREGLVIYATSTRFSYRGNDEPLAEGQEVRERQELIHLPTTSTFLAETKVHESSLDKIAVGMPVRISVDALPGLTFMGTVTTIAPLPDPMSMFMNSDLKLYTTEIQIAPGPDVLRTGMSCKAEITVEHHDSVLAVPVQSVVRVDGRTCVFIREGDNTVIRPVTIGLDNNRMVHIRDGLQPGDRVLLAPPLDTESQADSRGGITATNSVPRAAATPALKAAPAAAAADHALKRAPDATSARVGATADRDRAERLRNMSPEEREAARKRMGERGERRPRREGAE